MEDKAMMKRITPICNDDDGGDGANRRNEDEVMSDNAGQTREEDIGGTFAAAIPAPFRLTMDLFDQMQRQQQQHIALLPQPFPSLPSQFTTSNADATITQQQQHQQQQMLIAANLWNNLLLSQYRQQQQQHGMFASATADVGTAVAAAITRNCLPSNAVDANAMNMNGGQRQMKDTNIELQSARSEVNLAAVSFCCC